MGEFRKEVQEMRSVEEIQEARRALMTELQLFPCALHAVDKTWKTAIDCMGFLMGLNVEFDRLESICAAEKYGRCYIAPCKVGDEMFSYRWDIKNEKYEVRTGNVKNVRYDAADNSVMLSDGEMYGVLGKTVFLAREAAEAALKERESQG